MSSITNTNILRDNVIGDTVKIKMTPNYFSIADRMWKTSPVDYCWGTIQQLTKSDSYNGFMCEIRIVGMKPKETIYSHEENIFFSNKRTLLIEKE